MKLRTGLLLGAAFAVGVIVGPVLGGPTVRLWQHELGGSLFPAALAQQAANGTEGDKADTYRLLNLFADVFERVRAEYVQPVSDRELIENAINGMLTGLDPHSSYMNAKSFRDMQVQTRGEFGGLGIEVTQEGGYIKVISPIDDTPASRAGVKAGDLITQLNGKTVQGLSLNDAVDRMRGPPNTPISLTLRRQGVDKPIEVTMKREVIKIQVVKSHLEAPDIAYIRITSFSEQTDTGLRAAFKKLQEEAHGKLRGLVLDLRNNPGGLLDQAISVSDDLLDRGEIVSTRARHPEDGQRWNAKPGDITDGLPIVVLINGGSASASEIVAGALQDQRRAILMGSRSFGKGSVQTVMPLPGNGAMRLTTARYYTPSGRSIQGLGITPDIEVHASRSEVPTFGPAREADLRGALSNTGGAPQNAAPPRNDLPAIAKDIPKLPPEDQPKYDPADWKTDFQLQEALKVLHAMPEKGAAR
ncbi:MAG: peptidase S41 [Rhodospirillales bacterium 70-18]|nr:S41 family peptidase [Rhodospirillales bacterium]OJY77409.1 MAG: peptidase S41 [Rhodospirillales bacterium 70-18]